MRARDPAKERAVRDHAIEMVVTNGFDGLSMQKLADKAGVSPATIYIYFKDREDLLLRLYEEENARMAEVTLAGFDPAMHFADGLKVQWKNRARYCIEHPRPAHFLEQMRYSPLASRCEKLKHPFVAAMRTFVENAIRRGELARMPVEVYWSVAFAPLYQLLKFHVNGRGMPGTERFVLDDAILEQTLALVLKALKPERGSHVPS
jgi:AcrR family transcriptional regulator